MVSRDGCAPRCPASSSTRPTSSVAAATASSMRAMYLVAFAFSAVSLAITWHMYAPWLRVVAVVVGLVTLVSLRWRRTHPAAVGIGVGAISLVMPHGLGREPRSHVQRCDPGSWRRSGRHRRAPDGLGVREPAALPHRWWLLGQRSGLPAADGRRPRVGSLRARAARACASRCARRAIAPPRRPARPSGGGSPARCTMCSLIASRCSPSTPARSSSTPTHRQRRSPRRPA